MLGELARHVFGALCHQDTSILLRIDGQTLSLCPRCLGLHLGFFVAFWILWTTTRTRVAFATRWARLVLGAAVASVLIDWGAGGRLGLYEPGTASRLATGLAAGAALAVLFSVYREHRRRACRHHDAKHAADPASSVAARGAGALVLSVVAFGATAVFFLSWTTLTLLALVSVIANAALASHAVVVLLRSPRRNSDGAPRALERGGVGWSPEGP